MRWTQWARQLHRWASVAFTLTVVANFAVMGREQPIAWVAYLPLAPLAALFFTGLYLFALPWVRGRAATPAPGADPA